MYDSDGHIVYRVDNYGSKCSDNVCLMDLRGNIVVNIHKKVRTFFLFYSQERAHNQAKNTITFCEMFCILEQR